MSRFTLQNKQKFLALAAGLVAACLWPSGRATAQIINQAPFVAGVSVDADGVLRTKLIPDATGQLRQKRRDEARAALDRNVAATSKLRKISLNRLEEAVKEQLAAGKRLTPEMMYLAGLTRIQYVFCYPDTKDIVIAGPAEGWGEDPSGRICGIQSGRPVIELQDLVVALRAFTPGKPGVQNIGCSIDPTKDGLQRLNAFLSRSRPNPADTDSFISRMKEALGLQNVTINGVPSETHFAQVLVEADYQMKLIGLSIQPPPIKMKSWVDRANPSAVSRNALQRWYFVPDYECLRVSDDETAMELVGEGVKLLSADEFVAQSGAREKSSVVDRASQAFTDEFTKKYPQVASALPVYAQLRNLIDLSVIAAFMRQKDVYAKSDWRPSTFADERAYSVQTFSTPKQVETAVTAVWRGTKLMTPIGGGVHIAPHEAISSSNLLKDDGGKVSQARDKVDVKNLAKGRWWWD